MTIEFISNHSKLFLISIFFENYPSIGHLIVAFNGLSLVLTLLHLVALTVQRPLFQKWHSSLVCRTLLLLSSPPTSFSASILALPHSPNVLFCFCFGVLFLFLSFVLFAASQTSVL